MWQNSYTEVYKNVFTKVEVAPVLVTAAEMSGVNSGPVEIEWRATARGDSTPSVELELFTVNAEVSMEPPFPKLTSELNAVYRGVLSSPKFRLVATDLSLFWIKGEKEKIDFSASIPTNVNINLGEWRRPMIGTDQRQSEVFDERNVAFGVGQRGTFFNVSAPSRIEILIVPGSHERVFRFPPKNMFEVMKSRYVVKFDSQLKVPTLSLIPSPLKPSTPGVETNLVILPFLLARLKSAGYISVTFNSPSSRFIFLSPTFNLNAFGITTLIRDIIAITAHGDIQVGSQSHPLNNQSISIDGPGLNLESLESTKLNLKGQANFVLLDSIQLIPTIAQSIGKEVWAAVAGGVLGIIGTLVGVWWPSKKRR